MSFSFEDHSCNRFLSVNLNDFLNKTVGAGVQTAAEISGLSVKQSRSVGFHAVSVAQAVLDGMRGEHFDSVNAARSFVTAELNGIVDDHFHPAADDYSEHLYSLSPYEKGEFMEIFKSRAVRETISLISSYLQMVIDEERKRQR